MIIDKLSNRLWVLKALVIVSLIGNISSIDCFSEAVSSNLNRAHTYIELIHSLNGFK